MKFTTLPSPFEVEALFPFLKGRGRRATRLHPRKQPGLPLFASKIGGTIPWPKNEQIPVCSQTGTRAVPVLQLNKSDIPLLNFPAGKDLLQLVWFPGIYDNFGNQPSCMLFWRSSETLVSHTKFKPVYVNANDCFKNLHECSVHPEEILEYPPAELLADAERDRIYEWDDEREAKGLEALYEFQLSALSGNKIGGYPVGQNIEKTVPRNQSGDIAELLVMFSDYDWEHDRWRPVEVPPLPDETVFIRYPDGSSAEISKSLMGLDEDEISDEDAEAFWEAKEPLGTYLKVAYNVFIDRTREPNALIGV